MKKIGVALLGLGVVGGGTYKILTSQREFIKRNDGIDIEIKCVLEKNLERCNELGVDPSIVSTDIERVISDPEISVVAEFFGGIEPAKTFLVKALEAGKSIVTANKEMFSKSWPELEAAAERGGGGLYFEASCAGGIPIIRTLTDGMQANRVTSLKGIVNGTTNYILSRMSDEGVDYASCLKDAQALGYAEADPTADVEGFDAMYKNSILSSLAYKKRVGQRDGIFVAIAFKGKKLVELLFAYVIGRRTAYKHVEVGKSVFDGVVHGSALTAVGIVGKFFAKRRRRTQYGKGNKPRRMKFDAFAVIKIKRQFFPERGYGCVKIFVVDGVAFVADNDKTTVCHDRLLHAVTAHNIYRKLP